MAATRYHRVTSARRWRGLLEIVLSVGYWLVAVVVISACMPAFADLDELDEPASFVAMGLTLALLIPATQLAARTMRRPAGTLSAVGGRLRWRWLVRCIAISLAFYALAIAAEVAAGGTDQPDDSLPSSTAFLPLLGLIVLTVPVQAAGEEYLFRGTLLQAIGAWSTSPWPAIVLSSAAFAAVHMAPIEVTALLFAMASIDAWLTIETGGLEAAIAGHTVNNVIAFVLLAAAGERIDISTDDFTWYSLAIYALCYAAYAWAVVRQARKHLSRAA